MRSGIVILKFIDDVQLEYFESAQAAKSLYQEKLMKLQSEKNSKIRVIELWESGLGVVKRKKLYFEPEKKPQKNVKEAKKVDVNNAE